MHNKRQSIYGIVLAVTLCLATAYGVPSSPAAGNQPADKLTLGPTGWPEGVTSAAEYQAYVQATLNDLRSRAAYATTPQAKALASLDLASFALTRGTEPALTWQVFLGVQRPAEGASSRSALTAGKEALTWVDPIVQDKALDMRSIVCEARRLSALAAMETVLLEKTLPADALQVARQAEAIGECLPEPAQQAWDLLFAACLDKADRPRDAQLRLQRLLRNQEHSSAHLLAQVLSCRILAHAQDHASAIALVNEYLQAAGWSQQAAAPADLPKTAQADDGATTQPASQDDSSLPIAACTLLLTKATILADWAGHLDIATQEPYGGQTAEMLRNESSNWMSQASKWGPSLVRLLPVLQGLDESARQ
jgi:hypothetical protein